MAQPTAQDVHIDAGLSQISVAYRNAGYIADEIFPLVPTDKQSDYYYTFDKEFWFRNHVASRAPGAVYEKAGFTVSKTQFVTLPYALGFDIPWEVRDNQDAAIDLERDGAEFLGDQFALNREILAAGLINYASWGTSTARTGTAQWNDYASSDPRGDVDTARAVIKKATGQDANVLVINEDVWDKIKWHPDILDAYKYVQKGIMTPELVAGVFGIEKILVGGAVYNSAAEAATFSGAYIWAKEAIMIYVPKAPGIRIPAAGYCFVWDPGGGLTVQIVRWDDEGRDTTVLKAKQQFIHKIIGSDLGYRYSTVIA